MKNQRKMLILMLCFMFPVLLTAGSLSSILYTNNPPGTGRIPSVENFQVVVNPMNYELKTFTGGLRLVMVDKDTSIGYLLNGDDSTTMRISFMKRKMTPDQVKARHAELLVLGMKIWDLAVSESEKNGGNVSTEATEGKKWCVALVMRKSEMSPLGSAQITYGIQYFQITDLTQSTQNEIETFAKQNPQARYDGYEIVETVVVENSDCEQCKKDLAIRYKPTDIRMDRITKK